MDQIRIAVPKLDPELVEAAVENVRRSFEVFGRQAGECAALVAASVEEFGRQAGEALASLRRP